MLHVLIDANNRNGPKTSSSLMSTHTLGLQYLPKMLH